MSYVETVNDKWRFEMIKHDDLIDPYELAYVKLKNQIFKHIGGLKDLDKRTHKFLNKCHKIDLQLKISQLKKKANKKSYYKV